MADLTNTDFRINGVNQDTSFIKQRSYLLDGTVNSGLLSTGTHSVIVLPKGEAVVKLRVVSLESATSSGAATLQFKIGFDNVAEAVNSNAIALAALAAGDVYDFPVNAIKGYDDSKPPVVQLTVGTAAFTKLKLMVVVDTLPVTEFTTLG